MHVVRSGYKGVEGIMRRTGSFGGLREKEGVHSFVGGGGVVDTLSVAGGLPAFFRAGHLEPRDKFQNAVRFGTSPLARGLVDANGAMGSIQELDDATFTEWFTKLGASRGSIDRMWDPVALALGYLDCDTISARAMLTILMLFAVQTEASALRMLQTSPQTGLHDPILAYLQERGVQLHLNTVVAEIVHDVDYEGKPTRVNGIVVGTSTKVKGILVGKEYKEFDVVVSALDVPGVKAVLPPSFRTYPLFDDLYSIECVPITTVQLRFDGWVTELNNNNAMMDVTSDYSDGTAPGIDNLLYTSAGGGNTIRFASFCDLAVTSPTEYYKPNQGSLIQATIHKHGAVFKLKDTLVSDCVKQLNSLFPSSRRLTVTWSSVVKLTNALYSDAPGQDRFRPKGVTTPVENFFLAGSYTCPDYPDSMEGATRSGIMVADEIITRADGPNGLASKARKLKEEGYAETAYYA